MTHIPQAHLTERILLAKGLLPLKKGKMIVIDSIVEPVKTFGIVEPIKTYKNVRAKPAAMFG